MKVKRIPSKVVEKLQHYVYLYVDPADNSIFYIGKGVGQRALSHLSDDAESQKVKKIEEIRKRGERPRIEILIYGLESKDQALQIESAAIDALGKKTLTNQVRGWKSRDSGRQSLEDLIVRYGSKPVRITEPVILIRVNQLYQDNMGKDALYEITRGVWRIGKRRDKAKHALAVYKGIVREVYRIDQWHPAGTTTYNTRAKEEVQVCGRWEFTGGVAESKIRDKYVGRSVENYLAANSQNPIKYVNC
jgi:uncharacterized protein